MWKQRSRNRWLKEGDRNAKYFHYRANQRNHRNLISGLEDDNGNWVDDEACLGKVVERYFENIFSSSNPSRFEYILNGIQHIVVDEPIGPINGDFQASDVKQALNEWPCLPHWVLMVYPLSFISPFGILCVMMSLQLCFGL